MDTNFNFNPSMSPFMQDVQRTLVQQDDFRGMGGHGFENHGGHGWQEKQDGLVELTLTDKGKNKVLVYDPDYLKISVPKKWDKKWRIVVFDIPEKQRGARDSLRSYLKKLDFYELQKSIFVHPYPCDDIFDFLVEFHNIRKYTRFILADDLDNSLHLKKIFNLS